MTVLQILKSFPKITPGPVGSSRDEGWDFQLLEWRLKWAAPKDSTLILPASISLGEMEPWNMSVPMQETAACICTKSTVEREGKGLVGLFSGQSTLCARR